MVLDNLTGHKTPELLLSVDVRQRDHGALHAFGSLLAKHDRVDAADTQAASVGGALPGEALADHRVVRSCGARMESGSDAV